MRAAIDFSRRYSASHRHPVNRLSHAIAIPMLAVGASQAAFQWAFGWGTLGLVLGGVALLLAGHRAEGNKPVVIEMLRERLAALRRLMRAV